MTPSNLFQELPSDGSDDAILDAAARWVVRRDRGLTDAEQKELESWLRADPRHASAVARSAAAWRNLDRAHYAATRAAETPRSWNWIAVSGLAAAAALAIAFTGWWRTNHRATLAPHTYSSEVAGLRTVHLPDDTTVFLNANSEITEEFVPAERRVSVLRGEAHFEVSKNPARPFVVRAGSVLVRAVGTAFDVVLQPSGVQVFVTEGRVRVAHERTEEALAQLPDTAEPPMVTAGHTALVKFSPGPGMQEFSISEVKPAEMQLALAWQSPLLRLGGATLAQLAAKFQERTGQRLIVEDASLASLRIGGRFKEDDVAGFVRVLEDNYGVKSKRAPDGAIVLSRP